MTRNLTCIVCPLGCDLTVELADGKVLSVSGNTCPRGKKYAETECIAPMRTVTSTVRCDDGSLVSVKTDSPIPKEKMFVAEIILSIHPKSTARRRLRHRACRILNVELLPLCPTGTTGTEY